MSTHVAEFGKLVRAEMGHYGLLDAGWEYGYDRAKTRLGCCFYSDKILTFSLPYIECNEIEAMHNTVLHEIAHALVGPREGHGNVWKAKALSIGAKPQRCNSDPNIIQPMGEYMFKCNCSVHYFHRKMSSSARKCLKCGYKGFITNTPIGFNAPVFNSPAPVSLESRTSINQELLLGMFN